MTFNRNITVDRQNTVALLAEVANGGPPTSDVPNWLEHRGGNAAIDAELLWGTTKAQMRTHRGAVNEHLRHLNVEHGLTVIERNGIYRLAVLPL